MTQEEFNQMLKNALGDPPSGHYTLAHTGEELDSSMEKIAMEPSIITLSNWSRYNENVSLYFLDSNCYPQTRRFTLLPPPQPDIELDSLQHGYLLIEYPIKDNLSISGVSYTWKGTLSSKKATLCIITSSEVKVTVLY